MYRCLPPIPFIQTFFILLMLLLLQHDARVSVRAGKGCVDPTAKFRIILLLVSMLLLLLLLHRCITISFS